MKKLLLSLAAFFCVQSAMAISLEQQQEALAQLEIARAEIATVRALIPGFLRKSVGKNLENADERINYAQNVLAITRVSEKYFCTVESTFDGQFSGRGASELEASNDAIQKCQARSRHNGFFCKKDSVVCQKQQ